MGYLDPRELNDLIALAERGGIGKGVALTDCVAEEPDQLMYISGDELILLRDLDKVLLASCEGIIGWVERDNVKFDSLASTSTNTNTNTPPKPSIELPKTILTAPSPPRQSTKPTTTSNHPVNQISLSDYDHFHGHDHDDHSINNELQPRRGDVKRISGPFELDSPQVSPSLGNQDQDGFFGKQQQRQQPPLRHQQNPPPHDVIIENRDSIMSTTSSEALGGIGGFMMGGNESEDDHHAGNALEELTGERSPSTPSIITPHHTSSISHITPSSPSIDRAKNGNNLDDTDDTDDSEDEDKEYDEDDTAEWDIYDDYARESMYGPAKRMSLAIQQRRLSRAAKSASKAPSTLRLGSKSPSGMDELEPSPSPKGLDAARDALEGRVRHKPPTPIFRPASAERNLSSTGNDTTVSSSPLQEEQEQELLTPKIQDQSSPSTPNQTTFQKIDIPSAQANGRSVATELRLRIMREREKVVEEETERESSNHHGSYDTNRDDIPVIRHERRIQTSPVKSDVTHDDDRYEGGIEHVESDKHSPASSTNSHKRSAGTLESSEESATITTPQPTEIVTFSAASPTDASYDIPSMTKGTIGHSLLASPLPNDENEVKVDISENGIINAPNLVPPPPINHAPNMSPHINHPPWIPGSPSSPHSVAATRQAVDAHRSASEGKRPRGLTLVGRMEADLLASKGPVPITFLVNGPGMPLIPTLPTPAPSHETIGLGLPSSRSQTASPAEPARRATSPLASPILPNEETSNQASPFPPHPHPVRSATSPVPPSTPATQSEADLAKPSPPFSVGRPRARSFSATVAKSLGVGKKDSTPPLTIKTSMTPPVPSINSPLPQSSSSAKKSFFGGRKSSFAPSTPPPGSPSGLSRVSESGSSVNVNHLQPITPATYSHGNDSTPSIHPPASARSSSFSFNSKSKTPRKPPRALPSPISHKDFAEETIKAEGLDFELIQPKKQSSLLSPIEDFSPTSPGASNVTRPELTRHSTMTSQNSSSSLKPLPETDEWGFMKANSPVPEIFQSRSQPGDHRVIEQKWLSIILTPLAANTQPPKKVRKLVLDAGVPSSLRGKVWAWFMAGTLSARTPGLYQELIEHDNGLEDERIDKDVAGAYPDHSIFATPNSPGQQDLRLILRAYSNFAPAGYRSEMALIAGALLIHCVAEDSFWLLSGLVNAVLKDYYSKERTGLRIDAAVFMGLIIKEEPKIGKLFKEIGLHPISFLDKWFSQLFIRCLPWPTTLRVIDAVVSEGPRFLLIASISILSLSRDRLLSLQKNPTAILHYLQNLPQDSLLLPENFMKTCESQKFDEKDYKKWRSNVEKEVMG
ncbi:uncharacterized protein IL334_003644 [Kwoniella shivajii]|uniref:Rab-GAP TBC domain-containing protein n=1 Tax=Kwoniella shivajii TaxID=564305 RepID=A0ABZ1CY60_9TREE|nr:hypothetical protein IL334_003644 [Kwoniella shivajii]